MGMALDLCVTKGIKLRVTTSKNNILTLQGDLQIEKPGTAGI